MVKFGSSLAAARRPGWENKYLDYGALKKALKQLSGEIAVPALSAPANPMELISSSAGADAVALTGGQRSAAWVVRTSADFADILDGEIEKVALFFLQEQGRLAAAMADLVQRWPPHEELAAGCRDVGTGLAELLRFLELNNTGLRKILKKHDKMIESHRITGMFLNSRGSRPDSHLRLLSRHEGLSSLLASVRSGLNVASCAASAERAATRSRAVSVSGALSGARANRTSPRSAKARIFFRRFERTASFDEGEPVLLRVANARLRLHAATGFLTPTAYLARSAGLAMREPLLFEESSSDVEGGGDAAAAASRRKREPQLSMVLNLTSTFLYMMNYYIVLPTSSDYATKVHMSAACSGVIVGCTPIAACLSAFVYSSWTNRSFRTPLLATASLLVLGNLLYVLALPLGVFWPLLVGRFVNGCGGARGINRRYISDTVPTKHRTSASAAFVTAGALGMAAGPGVAALINTALAGRSFYLPFPGGFELIFNSVTAPGFCMAALWVLYFMALLVGFKEPDVVLRRAKAQADQRKASGQPRVKQPLLVNAKPHAQYGSVQQGAPPARAKPPAAPKPKGVCAILSSDRATLFCLVCYFILKLVQEGLLTSTPLLTNFYFAWDATTSGCFLTILGSLTLPLNFMIGYLSRTRDDRYLGAITQSLVIVGLIIMLMHSRSSTSSMIAQYCTAAIIIFSASSMLEGVTMSLLSKVVPPSLAHGIFNAGLLATEAGTSGRAVGDILVTVIGSAIPLDSLLVALQVPNLVLSVAVLIAIKRLYPVLY